MVCQKRWLKKPCGPFFIFVQILETFVDLILLALYSVSFDFMVFQAIFHVLLTISY